MKSILYVLIIGIFVSCNSKAYRAVTSINKGYNLDSVAADKRAKQIAPCITVSQDTTEAPEVTEITTTDTITRVVTDTVQLRCKDGSVVDTVITKKYYDINHRTTKTNTFYITKTIEDKGKDIVIRDLQKQVEKIQHKRDFWMYCGIISTLLFLLAVIFILLKKSLNKIP